MISEVVSNQGGGIQVHVSTLSKSLQSMGHKVHPFPVPPLYLTKDSAPHRAASLVMNLSAIMYHLFKLLIHLENDEINFDVIHVHGPRVPLILGYALKKITGKPLLVTMHEVKSESLRFNQLWKRADKIISISKEISSVLTNHGGDRPSIVYIPNMVQLEPTDLLPQKSGKNILFIGRLSPEKIGILKILLKALPEIIREVPDTKVWIAGQDGPSRKEIEEQATRINEAHGVQIVTLLGYIQPHEYIAKAAVVIGVGRVALESMIQNKPVIVGSTNTEKYFIGDLVTQENIEKLETYNFTGRNYRKKKGPKEMSSMIKKLLTDDQYSNWVTDYCRLYVMHNFENDVVVKRIIKAYSDTLIHAQTIR